MRDQEPPRSDGQTLLDSVLEEQEVRWRRGERPTIEGCLASHPALRDDAEAVVDLIYQEYVIRRQLGERVQAGEYVRRFPAWSEALIQQFAVDEILAPVPAVTLSDGVPAQGRPGLAVGEEGPSAPLPSLAGYEVLDELGRGGMGIVYKARDLKLGRIVAIKRIAESAYAQPAQLRRFLAEAEAVARLKHPNIIAIHAIGQEAGRPFFSLEFAEGGNLAQRLAQGPLSSRPAAELVAVLARAVGAAHQAGIIHRDLKPSNVLLMADEIPKIGDFGLAKLLDDESARTLSGEVLGTPSYMAPEQAEGHSRAVGPAADIYALGAILYQAITGRPPFLGASAVETLKLVATAEVVPPRRQRPEVPRDLETICLKCLEKEPARRYADAAALAEDLRRFLDGRPIAARPVGALGRLGRWGRRNPTLAGTTAALVLTFVLGTPTLLGLWLRARADHARAETERGRAEDQRTRAERERDRAERSRDRAIGALNVLLGTEDETLRSEEVRPYRKALIDAGMRESLALVHDLEGDPRAEVQRLHAYGALALIQHDGGDRAGAIGTIRKAIALAEDLARRNPADLQVRFALATSLHRAATILADDAEGPALARRSNEILESIPEEAHGADDRNSVVLTAMNHYNMGDLHWQKGRPALALPEFLAARAAYDQAIAGRDRSPRTRYLAARNLLYLCRILGQERLDEALAAGQQAESIFQTLVREHPDQFEHAWQLSLAQEELGLHLGFAGRWAEAVPWREAVRRTLQQMAACHGKLVSRMAQIQERIAAANSNLVEAYRALDPVKYAPAIRQLAAETHEICDKLSLVEPLPWNLRIVHAFALSFLAEFQEEDGLQPDLEGLLEVERLWTGLLQQAPTYPMARVSLAIIRRWIARELRDRGRPEEAAGRDRGSLETVRGDPDLLCEVALFYARNAGLAGKYPTKLDAQQLEQRRRRFMADAVAVLHQAVADGIKDVARLKNEPLFDPIRSDPAFRAILDGLEFPADPFAR